jgi:hypothetical protein
MSNRYPIPESLPAPLTRYYGWALSYKCTVPAGTPIIPANNQPWREDADEHIVAWVVTDELPLTEEAQSWAESYGFPVYRSDLDPLDELKATASTAKD